MYTKEEKENIVPIVDALESIAGNDGFVWLMDTIKEYKKKQLDLLISDDTMDIDVDLERGKAMGADAILKAIDLIKDRYKNIMEEK